MKPRAQVLTESGAFRAWWSVAMIVLTVLLVAGAGVAYTNHVQRESDQRWCELLASLDQPGQTTTPRGREIQRQIHELRRDMGCEDR